MRLKTHFAATKSLIQRLIIATIRSGTATSIIALITVALFLSDKEANFCVGLTFCLGRVYTLTMLSNLNSRRAVSGVGESDEREPSGNSFSQRSGTARRNQESFGMSGIHVIRTVRMEDDVSITCLPFTMSELTALTIATP